MRKKIILLICGFWLITTFLYSQDTREQILDHYQMGNLYYQQGKYKEAQEEYQKALVLLNGRVKITQPVPEKPAAAVQEAGPQVRPMPVARPAQALEYRIGEEDILQISVWQNPDLDQEVIVRPDGKISFPLIGDIQASGLTLTELDAEFTRRLKEYLKYPEVSISLKKIGGRKVIVLGQVKNPGVYSVTGAQTILEAVSLAGGFTDDSVASNVILVRGGFENPTAQRVNLSKALNGDMRQNVRLQAEDIVFVPKKFIADLNYVLRQVLEPLSKGAVAYKEMHGF